MIRSRESHSFELSGILAIFCQALIPVDSSQGSHFWFSALQHEVLEADPRPLPGVIRHHCGSSGGWCGGTSIKSSGICGTVLYVTLFHHLTHPLTLKTDPTSGVIFRSSTGKEKKGNP